MTEINVSMKSNLTHKDHQSSWQIYEIKYTSAKYDGGLPINLTFITTHSHTLWACLGFHICHTSVTPRHRQDAVLREADTPFPSFHSEVCVSGQASGPCTTSLGFTNMGFVPWIRTQEEWETSSVTCLISHFTGLWLKQKPPRAPCYHIKYRITQQGSNPPTPAHTPLMPNNVPICCFICTNV